MRVLGLVRRGFQAHVGEHAIVSINVGRSDIFAIDWDDAFALFARGFGHQLFEPCAERGDSRRGDDGELVASIAGCGSENDSEQDSRILFGSNV